MSINVNVSSKELRLLLTVLVITALLLLLGTYIVNDPHLRLNKYLRMIFRQSDLGSENVFASWYSSMLLFCSALMSFACFICDRQRFNAGRASILNYGWVIFAGCFAALSFDEMGSIHEYIGDYMAFKAAGNIIVKEENSGWTVFYYLVGAVSLFMLLFSVIRLRKTKLAMLFFVAGVLCYLSNPLQENFEIENYGSGPVQRPVYLLLIEEGSELLGSLCFLISTSLYAAFAGRQGRQHEPVMGIDIRIGINRSMLMLYSLLFIVGLGATLLALTYMFGYVEGQNQVGVPKNWVCSVMAFIVSLYCFYVSANKTSSRTSYWLMGAAALAGSIYYGCDRFTFILPAYKYSVEAGFVLLSGLVLYFCAYKPLFRIRVQ